MRKAVPVLIVAVTVLTMILGIGAFAVHRATHATPKFYEQALARDPASQKQSSEEFLQQATALVSDVEQNERWQIVFTAEQINGWLAVDVPENLPDVIPPEVRDPRVAIQPGEATIACRLKTDKIDAVVSFSCDVFVSAPNEIALRFRRASLGSLRVPISRVLAPVGQAAAKLDLQLVWRQQAGDPVAVITLNDPKAESRRNVELEAIELGEGELLIAGRKRHLHDFTRTKWKKSPAIVAQKAGESAALPAAKTSRH